MVGVDGTINLLRFYSDLFTQIVLKFTRRPTVNTKESVREISSYNPGFKHFCGPTFPASVCDFHPASLQSDRGSSLKKTMTYSKRPLNGKHRDEVNAVKITSNWET